jgi:hypothetical protein
MRNYWLKIFAGAFGIFAVGMLVITGFRSVKTKVTTTLNSTDPIPIPLIGLVPFRVDNDKLGSLSRVELLRSDPEHLSGVRVVVRLADSISPDRLRQCVLIVDDVNNVDERTTFRCQPQGLPPSGVEPFGTVVLKGLPDTFPLLLPAAAVAELRRTVIKLDHQGLHVTTPPDPARVRYEERIQGMTDSLEARIEARSDSVDTLRDLADELEDSSATLAGAPRRAVQRSADSVRTRMRQVQDRLQLDETRLDALRQVGHFSPTEVDSLATLGQQIADSVRRSVARELQGVQSESRRQPAAVRPAPAPAPAPASGAGATTTVEAPQPPRPPRP